jgi:hypothetical protein
LDLSGLIADGGDCVSSPGQNFDVRGQLAIGSGGCAEGVSAQVFQICAYVVHLGDA